MMLLGGGIGDRGDSGAAAPGHPYCRPSSDLVISKLRDGFPKLCGLFLDFRNERLHSSKIAFLAGPGLLEKNARGTLSSEGPSGPVEGNQTG